MDLICKSCYLNNTTRIYIIFFHSHVFSQYLNNVIKITLPNGPYDFESTKKKKVKAAIYPFFLVICIGTKIDRNKTFHRFYQTLRVCLDTAYFVETEKLLLKVL